MQVRVRDVHGVRQRAREVEVRGRAHIQEDMRWASQVACLRAFRRERAIAVLGPAVVGAGVVLQLVGGQLPGPEGAGAAGAELFGAQHQVVLFGGDALGAVEDLNCGGRYAAQAVVGAGVAGDGVHGDFRGGGAGGAGRLAAAELDGAELGGC